MITGEQLQEIIPKSTAARRIEYLPFIQQAMQEFEITSYLREAAFLAQLAHESGSLRYMEEIASGKEYEGRKDLGNIQLGDGVRYKGRGSIQLTGRINYKTYGDLLGVDLISDPALAATKEIAFRIAGQFWKSHGLNELADRQEFKRITKQINGGYNGLEDRLKFYERAKKVLHKIDVAAPSLPTPQLLTNEIVVPAAVADAGSKKSLWATIIALPGLALTWLMANIGEAFGWLKDREILKWVLIVGGVILVVYLIRQIVMSVVKQAGSIVMTLQSMKYHADPNSNNVTVESPNEAQS